MTKLEIRKQIETLVAELCKDGRNFKPCYPWVFVYVLPKSHMHGSIILPEKQNKITHEGVVVATWSTFRQYRVESGETVCIEKLSSLRAGDHVLFPHWSGLPVPGYDETQFRIVKEEGWERSKEGGIYAVIDYPTKQKLDSVTLSGA